MKVFGARFHEKRIPGSSLLIALICISKPDARLKAHPSQEIPVNLGQLFSRLEFLVGARGHGSTPKSIDCVVRVPLEGKAYVDAAAHSQKQHFHPKANHDAVLVLGWRVVEQ